MKLSRKEYNLLDKFIFQCSFLYNDDNFVLIDINVNHSHLIAFVYSIDLYVQFIHEA